MSAQSGQTKPTTTKSTETEAEVLYQKLGDKWFAFSVIDGEVFMSPVDEEVIREVRSGKNDGQKDAA